MKKLCWILIIFSVFRTEVLAKEWNGIIPCVSTRLEAEKILGKNEIRDEESTYRYKKFDVHILYERKDANDPDKDVVESLTVYPDKTILLAKYIKKIPNSHKDFVKFELDARITHVYGDAIYRNQAEGFAIRVQKNEKDEEIISNFSYFAGKLPSNSSSQCG